MHFPIHLLQCVAIMESQAFCQEKETSPTTSQCDLSFKCFNEQSNHQQCKHLKRYSLGIWMATSGLCYKDAFLSWLMGTSSDAPSHCLSWWGFVVNRLKMHLERKIRTAELAYLLPAAVVSLPSHLFFLPLPLEPHCPLCILLFLLSSLHWLQHPLGSSLRWFNSQSPHKTIGFLWLTWFSA